MTNLVAIEPTKHQRSFLEYPLSPSLFLGDCGAGKTTALLMAALQRIDCPTYRALFVAKSHQMLVQPGGVIDVSKQLVDGAEWNQSRQTWRFPSGATLMIASCGDGDEAHHKFMGGSWQCVCIDNADMWKGDPELRDPDEDKDGRRAPMFYGALLSRLRSSGNDPEISVRVSSSTSGIGWPWVRSLFMPNITVAGSLILSLRSCDSLLHGANHFRP